MNAEEIGADKVLAARIKAALHELAEGCAATACVATKLLAAGCAGEPEKCNTCPLAAWLTLKLGLRPNTVEHVSINGYEARVVITDSDGYRVTATVGIPYVLQTFVGDFDARLLPDEYHGLYVGGLYAGVAAHA